MAPCPLFFFIAGGETRLTPTPGGAAGTVVTCPGDADCWTPLYGFTATERHSESGPTFGSYDPGEEIYDDLDENTPTTIGGGPGIDEGEVVTCVSVPVGALVHADIVVDSIPAAPPDLATWKALMFYDDEAGGPTLPTPFDTAGSLSVTVADAQLKIPADIDQTETTPDTGANNPPPAGYEFPGAFVFGTTDVPPYTNNTGPGAMAHFTIDTSNAVAGNSYALELDETDTYNLNIADISGPNPIINGGDAVIAVSPATCANPDSDGDGIPDASDNCPDDYNPLHENKDAALGGRRSHHRRHLHRRSPGRPVRLGR